MLTRSRRATARALIRFACAVLCAGIVVAAPATAHAYREPNDQGGPGSCGSCHIQVWDGYVWVMTDPSNDCVECHASSDTATPGVGYSSLEVSGPHGGYSTTTRKCAACHTVHDAVGGVDLLPAATVVATCNTCHDGTGGFGPYGALASRSVPVGGRHRIASTDVIPGGDGATGGDRTVSFKGPGGTLICTDCHSVHGSDVVQAYLGERRRLRQNTAAPVSTRLLRRTPTGGTAPVDEYGADWCLACHAGQVSGATLHNHPVESAITWAEPATRFVYQRLAILDSGTTTHGTLIGSLGGTAFVMPPADQDLQHSGGFVNTAGNRGYLVPWPRTTGAGGQNAHNVICQQCHEDSRDVGDLAADGSADVVEFAVAAADGVAWNGSAWVDASTDNPRFQNFPHETENARMVLETGDDLCLNCHTTQSLP